MLSSDTIAEWVDLANISQYLAANDNAKLSVMQWAATKGNYKLPFLLGFYADIVNWASAWAVGTQQLDAVATYMYSLCGKYLNTAQRILNNAGGIIVNPTTGGKSTLAYIRLQFKVGTTGSPMAAGDTELTLNYKSIMVDSVSVETPNANLPENEADQVSVNVAYSDTEAVITFNQAVQDGDLYIVTGLYFIALT